MVQLTIWGRPNSVNVQKVLWCMGMAISWAARFAVSVATVVLIIAVLLLGRVGL